MVRLQAGGRDGRQACRFQSLSNFVGNSFPRSERRNRIPMRWPGDGERQQEGRRRRQHRAEERGRTCRRAQSLNKSDPSELRRPPHLAGLGSPQRACVPWGLLLLSSRRPCSIFAILVRGGLLLLRLIFRSIDLLPSPLPPICRDRKGSVPWEGTAAEAVPPFETKGLSTAAHE